MVDEKKKEFSRKIVGASKTEIIVIMYDIIKEYMKEALELLQREEPNREAYLFALKKAKDFVNELSSSLDMKYPISYQLISLYNYIRTCLIKAEMRRDNRECEEALAEAQKIIDSLRKAFFEVAKQDDSGSMIESSQKVYAGLTYGPGSRLNETVINSTHNF